MRTKTLPERPNGGKVEYSGGIPSNDRTRTPERGAACPLRVVMRREQYPCIMQSSAKEHRSATSTVCRLACTIHEAVLGERLLEVVSPRCQVGVRVCLDVPLKPSKFMNIKKYAKKNTDSLM